MAKQTDRRAFLKRSVLGVSGAAVVGGLEERRVEAALQQDISVTPEQVEEAARDPMPYGQLGKLKISRLILGSNLIAGFAHSRDLLYVSPLFKAYNTQQKVLDTFELAEQLGVNAILTSPPSLKYVQMYNQQRGGHLQAIVYIFPHADATKAQEEVARAIDQGACAISTRGDDSDKLVRDGKLEPLAQTLELIKRQGVPAGIGGHALETIVASEQHDLGAEFYHKTFHDDNYWSATPEPSRRPWCWYQPITNDHNEYHDNIFCLNAEETAAFMATVKKPWLAFKVLAAGAIHPRQGFSYAFRHGADFVCCGMFDFQLCDDVKLIKEFVRLNQDRARPWMA
jgi:hypothetical protein